jgi:uncharacterized protein YbjT (DUF2867 family)
MKIALVFGASGLVGSQLVSLLIKSSDYSKIKLFVRSPIKFDNSKVEVIQTDFNNLSNYINVIKGDDCFFCIGTTKKNSPDKNEYKRIELEIPKEIGQISKLNLVKSFSFVSSGYANPKHSGDYLRYKGLVEEELKRLQFDKLGILRPSFLIGERKENRIGEKIGILIFKILSPIFIGPLKKMKPIQANIVAKAMLNISKNDLTKNTFESNEIVELSKI